MKLFLVLILTGVIGWLAGCNTMEGAGKDIQRGGKAVSDSAREVRREM